MPGTSRIDTNNSTAIKAVIKATSFTNNSESVRFGPGLRHATAANTGGYNLLLYQNTSSVRFLNDNIAFGPTTYTYNWEMGVWLGFTLEYIEVASNKADLRGRIWKMTESEPSDWPYQWLGVDRKAGYPAITLGAVLPGQPPAKGCCREVYTYTPPLS